MIALEPWTDAAAYEVLRDLDAFDRIECALIRGGDAGALALFADWRSANAYRALSVVAVTRPEDPAQPSEPFALVGVMATGAAGVAQAALLSRDTARFRWPLGRLALELARRLPAHAAEYGLARIEARSWRDHPTAGRLLTRIGFKFECDLSGYGNGSSTFTQYSWTRTPGG